MYFAAVDTLQLSSSSPCPFLYNLERCGRLWSIGLLWWCWWQCICVSLTAMQIQDWLRSLRFTGGDGKSEMDNLKTLLPSLPSSFSLSSLSLSPSSIIGLGALASLTTYWLVTRPRPIQPPCDLQAQSIPVQVTVLLLLTKANIYPIKSKY